MTRTDKIMNLIAEYGDSCRNSFLASSEEFEGIRKIVQAMDDEIEKGFESTIKRATEAAEEIKKHVFVFTAVEKIHTGQYAVLNMQNKTMTLTRATQADETMSFVTVTTNLEPGDKYDLISKKRVLPSIQDMEPMSDEHVEEMNEYYRKEGY
jgi:hypothetical protein